MGRIGARIFHPQFLGNAFPEGQKRGDGIHLQDHRPEKKVPLPFAGQGESEWQYMSADPGQRIQGGGGQGWHLSPEGEVGRKAGATEKGSQAML